jgi:hypothetical protein
MSVAASDEQLYAGMVNARLKGHVIAAKSPRAQTVANAALSAGSGRMTRRGLDDHGAIAKHIMILAARDKLLQVAQKIEEECVIGPEAMYVVEESHAQALRREGVSLEEIQGADGLVDDMRIQKA